MSEKYKITIEDGKGQKQTIETTSFMNFAPLDDDRFSALICVKGNVENVLKFYRALKNAEKILNKQCPFLEYLNEKLWVTKVNSPMCSL